MIFNIILAFSVFFISLVGTKLVILTLQNRPVSPNIDILTGKRKMPIPENGGIALVFAVIIGFLGAGTSYAVIASIFLLTGLPLLGNILPFPRMVALIVRVIAITIPLVGFHGTIFSDLIPGLLDKSLAALFWLWIIYSFEKLEKLEGMLPVQIISVGAGIIAITILDRTFSSPLSIQALIIATAGLGFWWWNHYPAKVHGGEIASAPMGFVAGYLLLLAASKGYPEAAFIIPAYFLADSFVTFFNRPFSEKISKKSVTKKLFSLRAATKNSTPKLVVRLITGINMLLIFLATQILISPRMTIFNLLIAYAMVFNLVWVFARITNKPTYEI
jgi:UDP-N-acetylmuramyl pentapeptide phosphotransferase/UDP-N-acetylglucosamine-1-phosphate transferase